MSVAPAAPPAVAPASASALADAPRRRRLRAWHGSRALTAGTALLAVLLAIGLAGLFAFPDPNQQQLADSLVGPGQHGHLLGTDPLGRDLLGWISGGIRTAVLVGIAVVTLSAFVGVLIGTVSGYFGGMTDAVLMRVVDFSLAIPSLVLFIAASATIQPGKVSLILLMSTLAWVPYARLVRTNVLSERERGYVAAARLAGATRRRILFTHLLRANVTVVTVFASLQLGYAILWESALSFLGLGVQPPSTSLGFMISEARSHLDDGWWMAVFPGLAIVLLIVGFNLLGDGLRDVFHGAPEDGGPR